MAHPAQLSFFAEVVALFPEQLSGRVIDIGSHDLNGGPHQLIAPRSYLGVDLAPGANVHLIADGTHLPVPTGSFDTAMSSECFEHNPWWPLTLAEMARVTRPSGLVVFSAASTGRAEHGTTRSDGGTASPASVSRGREWYRNLTRRQVVRALDGLDLPTSLICIDRRVSDIYFAAVKEPTTDTDRHKLQHLADVLGARPGPNRYRHSRGSRLALHLFGDRVFRELDHARTRLLRRGRSSQVVPGKSQ